jgi:hypothetical protein
MATLAPGPLSSMALLPSMWQCSATSSSERPGDEAGQVAAGGVRHLRGERQAYDESRLALSDCVVECEFFHELLEGDGVGVELRGVLQA